MLDLLWPNYVQMERLEPFYQSPTASHALMIVVF